MRKDTLYITLSRDITSYTITSGQRAIATNVNYAVTIEPPTLTTNLAGRDVSVIISDTEGNTLTTATTFYPDTKNPYKAVTGSLLLDGTVYAKFFDGKPVDTAVRLPIVIRDKSATLLSSDIVVMNGGENAEPSASDETVAGLVNAIRFYDLAEFKAWLDGTKTRDDGLRPTDIVVGQWVHTQQDGSFICKELIGAEPSVAKNFTAIVTQFPLTGTLKMSPDNGIGLSVYSGDVYNEAEATSFSTNAITYKGDAFTFNAGDNQIARQKDNYALENRVNSTMKSTLDAIKADNDETYAAMLPVMNTTVEARDRAEAAASGAKASETRAVTAETNASTSEQNAEASKKSAAASEANAGLYRQQALAYAQKAETEAATATTKATESSTSSSEASASAGEALAHKNDARGYAEAARLSAESSAVSADSSATSAAASRSSADTAAQSESIAVSSASAAASSANTASEHKDAALSSATNAATSATNAATSATNAATSSTSASNFSSASSDSAKAAATSAADLAEAVATANSLDGRLTSVEAKNERQYDDYLTGYISHTLKTVPVSSLTNLWYDAPIYLLPCYKGFILHTHATLHYISPDGVCTNLRLKGTYNSTTIYFVAVYPEKTVVFLRLGAASVNSNFVKVTAAFDDELNVTSEVVSYDDLGENGFPDYVKNGYWTLDNHRYGWYEKGYLLTNECSVLDGETFEELGTFGTKCSQPTLNIKAAGEFTFYDANKKSSGTVSVNDDGTWSVFFGGSTEYSIGAALSGIYIPCVSGYYRYFIGRGIAHTNGIFYIGGNDSFYVDPLIILPSNCFAAIDGIYAAYDHGLCGVLKLFNLGTVKANNRIQRDYVGNFAIVESVKRVHIFKK